MEGVKGGLNVLSGMILFLWIALFTAVSPSLIFAGDIHEAASDLDFDSVKKMLKEDEAVVNRRDKKGRTPLVIACENNNTDMARLLLDAGADPGIQTLELSTALHEAAKGGNTELIRLLLSKDADTYAEDNRNQKKPIHYAVKNGHLEAVKLFLEDETMIEADNEHSWTPVMYAAYEGHKELVTYLLSKKAKLNARTFDGMTALHLAADKGHLDVVKLLIEKGAKPDTINARKNTPLHFACMRGHTDVAAFLLEKGANPNAADLSGSTPLHAVAESGSVETLKVLLKKKPDIDPKRYLGMTPLLVACGKGFDEMVTLFIKHKANIKAKNWYRYSGLHFACQVGNLKVVELLLSKGLDVNAKTYDGWYPILQAARYGHTDIVKLLLEKGADVNVHNRNRWTALHMASWYFHKDTAKLLIEKGSDVNALTKRGKKPIDISQSHMEFVGTSPESPAELLPGEEFIMKIRYGSKSSDSIRVVVQNKNELRSPVRFNSTHGDYKEVDGDDIVVRSLSTYSPFRLRGVVAKMIFAKKKKTIFLEKNVDVTWKEKYPHIPRCLFMNSYKVGIWLDKYNRNEIYDLLTRKGLKNMKVGNDKYETKSDNERVPLTVRVNWTVPVEIAQYIMKTCSQMNPVQGVEITDYRAARYLAYNYKAININSGKKFKKLSQSKMKDVLNPDLTQLEFHNLLDFKPAKMMFGRKDVEQYFIDKKEKDLIKNAEMNYELCNFKQAVLYYKTCLKKVKEDKTDIIKYLKERLALAEFYVNFNSGKWVSLTPPGDFTGWECKNGKWTVEKDGTLKGISDGKGFGLFLLHNAQIVDNYEITGQFDGYKEHGGIILNQILERGGHFVKGKLLGISKFICVHFAPKYNAVQLRKDNKKRGMKQIKMPLSDLTHFRIQVWNGTITVFVNGKPAFVNEYFPYGDWGVNEGRIGVGSSYHRHPGYVNKFQNLMIRKLTRRPLDPEEMFKHEEEGKDQKSEAKKDSKK